MISYLHIFEAREKVRFEPKERKTSTEESLLVILDVSESDSAAATQKNSFKIKRRALHDSIGKIVI